MRLGSWGLDGLGNSKLFWNAFRFWDSGCRCGVVTPAGPGFDTSRKFGGFTVSKLWRTIEHLGLPVTEPWPASVYRPNKGPGYC